MLVGKAPGITVSVGVNAGVALDKVEKYADPEFALTSVSLRICSSLGNGTVRSD